MQYVSIECNMYRLNATCIDCEHVWNGTNMDWVRACNASLCRMQHAMQPCVRCNKFGMQQVSHAHTCRMPTCVECLHSHMQCNATCVQWHMCAMHSIHMQSNATSLECFHSHMQSNATCPTPADTCKYIQDVVLP